MTKSQAKTALTFIALAILFFISSRVIFKFFFLFFVIGLICLVLGIMVLKGSKK